MRLTTVSNSTTKEWFSSQEHSDSGLGENWVPCSTKLPFEVTPQERCPSGVLNTVGEYAAFFYQGYTRVTDPSIPLNNDHITEMCSEQVTEFHRNLTHKLEARVLPVLKQFCYKYDVPYSSCNGEFWFSLEQNPKLSWIGPLWHAFEVERFTKDDMAEIIQGESEYDEEDRDCPPEAEMLKALPMLKEILSLMDILNIEVTHNHHVFEFLPSTINHKDREDG